MVEAETEVNSLYGAFVTYTELRGRCIGQWHEGLHS